MKKFHDKLAERMKTRGANRHDLLAMLGNDFSLSTTSNWLTGKAKPSLDVTLKIAKWLQMSLDYLADDELQDPPTTGQSLTDAQQQAIDMVDSLGLDKPEVIRRLARPSNAKPIIRGVEPITQTESA